MSSSLVLKNTILDRLSPSALSIFRILKSSEEQLTFNDIESRSKYSTRTVRHAIRQLKDAQLIKRIPNLLDTRRCYYSILYNINIK